MYDKTMGDDTHMLSNRIGHLTKANIKSLALGSEMVTKSKISVHCPVPNNPAASKAHGHVM